MTHYLICYDIRCPRRLARIHRVLQGEALALQYSLFLFKGTEPALNACLARLVQIMDLQQDDVRAYPLPRRGLHWQRGKPLLPDGLFWSGLPSNWTEPEN